MQNKVAIIFGATGQIGSYLAELVQYYKQVICITRRLAVQDTWRIEHLLNKPNFRLMSADITDLAALYRLFDRVIVDKDIQYEIYNLAAQSYVAYSFTNPITTEDITGKGHTNILEALLPYHQKGFKTRLYFAASSEIFGKNINADGYQDITTPFFPQSPYGVAKLASYHMNRIYRESYGMFNVSGIVFNTESPRRGEEFVTRKITKFFSKVMVDGKITKKLQLGNIYASRDWLHAKDTARAIYMILNNNHPKDYCVASGETHTVKDFLNECFSWIENKRRFKAVLEDFYEINQEFIRPNEVPYLKGYAVPIMQDLGWIPTVSFSNLVKEMLDVDYKMEKYKSQD